MSILHDVLFSLRSLRKARGFTSIVIVTMALGLGANTAVFSLIHATLLQPLPYPDSSHLLKLYEARTPNDYVTNANVAPANFLDWQQQSRAFTEMAASAGFRYNLTGNGLPEQVWAEGFLQDGSTFLAYYRSWEGRCALKKILQVPLPWFC